MTAPFVADANKLRNVQTNLEKTDILLNYLSKYGDDLKLLEFYISLEKNRTSETEAIRNEIRNTYDLFNTKRKLLEKNDLINLDLKVFKKEMIQIQDNIRNIKIKLGTSLADIKIEEKSLNSELEHFNNKFDNWNKPIKTANISVIKCSKTDFKINLIKEVKEFMDFVNKSNGHENGWPTEDHRLFLKIRNKSKNCDAIAANLHRLLPDISEEEIKKHELWYTEYLELRNKNKEALKSWRQSKDNNKRPPDIVRLITDHDIANECNKTTEDVRERIKNWKLEKDAQKQQQLLIDKQRQERAKQLEMRKRQDREEQKKSVEKWKESKLIEMATKHMKQQAIALEQRIRSMEANKVIKQYQSQDDLYIMKIRKSRDEATKKAEKRTQSSHLASRDPERLLKPTKQWLRRILDNEVTIGEKKMIPNIKIVQKLHVPEWRKKLP